MNAKKVISLLVICCFSIAAEAGHKGNYPHNNNHKHKHYGQFYDYAKVSSVTPIIETIEHRVPRQCNHRSTYYKDNHRSATPMIIGTIIGAAIGNELGHKKSNQRVGAAVGGILGGSIGYDLSSKHRSNNNHRCDNYAIEYEERVVGYDVQYRYRGATYRTTTKEHPGRRIQLKLNFEPVIS